MAQTSTKFSGDIMGIYANGTLVAHAQDSSLSVNMDVIDTTEKDSNKWVEHIRGNRGWEISGNSLEVFASSMSVEQLIDFLINAESVSIQFKTTNTADSVYSGSVSVTATSFSAPQNAPAAFDFTFTGNGALTRATSEAQDAINNMDSVPDTSTQSAMTTFVNTCVADSNWDDLDVFVFNLDTESNSLSDWKGVQNGLGVSAIVWSQLNGFEGDGIADYINTQVDLSTLTLYAQDDACAWVFVNDNRTVAAAKEILGVFDGTSRTSLNQTGTGIVYRVNHDSAAADISITSFEDGSNYALYRDVSATVKLYKDGVASDTEAKTSVSVPAGKDVYVLARNNNGTAQDFIDCSSFGYAFGRTLTDMAAFNTAIEQLKTDLGL